MPEGIIIADIAGFASGGSNSTLYDLTRNWLPIQWKNAVVEITIGSIRYHREIIDSGVNSLTFEALPAGVVVIKGTSYFISRPVNILKRVLEEVLRTITEASADTGIADDTSTVDFLDDTSKSWPVDAFVNLILEITEGSGAGQFAKIASNTATRLTFAVPMPLAPDATSCYRIGFYGRMASDISHWGGMALSGRNISADMANLDLPLTGLRDGLRGADDKDFSTLEADLEDVLSHLDVTLSALRDAICAPSPNARTLNDLYLALTDSSSGYFQGTTTDAYVDALDWGVAGLKEKTIIVANTGDTNGLHYKILVLAIWDSQPYEHVAEATLAAGAVARHILNDAYGRILVQVKSAVAGSPTDYEVGCIGNLA